jgi:hypothetical protein
VYGLSERASRFALPNTRGPGAARDEPYRLYNLDVFEYEVGPDRAHQPLLGPTRPLQRALVGSVA